MALNDTPQANQQINTTQPLIRTNFIDIDTDFAINHYAINGGTANDGKHLYLQLPEHAAPATAANEAGLYANVGTISGVTELCFRRENSGGGGGEIIPMTEFVGTADQGWCYLPSGILMKWKGSLSSTGNNPTDVNWGPNFTTTIFSGATIVTTHYNSGRVYGHAIYYSIAGLATPTVTIRCCRSDNPGTDYLTDYSFVIFGV